jgi:Putative MetA-pathway of phenol degradation
MRTARVLFVTALVCAAARSASTQDLFEIQVYPYETVEPGRTMAELHTNYFPSGTTDAPPGEFALNHQSHVTLEVTHGFTKYFECAGYLVTAAHVPNEGGRFAGARVRPRFRLPETPSLFFNVSISLELGFNRSEFEANTRTLEIRPILEHAQGRFYLSINPDLSKALKGPDADEGPEFEPGVKTSWNVTRTVAAGVEYYGATGDIARFAPRSEQHHMIFPTVDLDVSPDWELNFAVGRGLTDTSEHWIVKSIVGYKFRR